MPSLNFKGKNAVWNHHLSVPYHVLEKDKKNSLQGKNEDENLIIEGDNLLALKSLLPKYQGKIKCIYIDPPYNTGNEGWVYNDNVNNPIIKTWIKDTVGKEGDDMVRHDKWLCMMTPRLKLLRELLSDDGVIFVSIDDNEIHNLRSVMNEIFGYENFLANLIWESKLTGGHDASDVNIVHEYIVLYAKDKNNEVLNKRISNTEYPNFDKEKNKYFKWDSLWTVSHGYTPNCDYPILSPDNTEVYPWMCHKKKEKVRGIARWYWSKETYEENKEEILVKKDKNGEWKVYKKVLAGSEIPYKSVFLDKTAVGGTSRGKEELETLFGKTVFDNPKSSDLIFELLKIGSEKDSIILDSFAGSGTTAQAIMELNQEDEGNRKFILIQLPETITEKKQVQLAGYKYVHEITRDRVKKVIERDNLDIGFTYYKLGSSIDAKNILEGKDMPSWESLAKYVYNLATGKGIDDVSLVKSTWQIKGTEVYLIYKDSIEELKNLAITRDWLESVKEKEAKKIVYAPACFLDKETLDEYNISFVQIPFNLFTRT
jgi:adenine-specific DNA-methyltransferase